MLPGIFLLEIHAFILCKSAVFPRLALFGLLDFLSKSFLMRPYSLFCMLFPVHALPILPGIGISRLIGSTAAARKPSFSYIAKKKNGSIAPTMISAAPCVPNTPLVRKYKGTPTSAAPEKQIICLLVRFNATFVLIPLRSFGTGTDIAIVCSFRGQYPPNQQLPEIRCI